jgi:hypothetical protein
VRDAGKSFDVSVNPFWEEIREVTSLRLPLGAPRE